MTLANIDRSKQLNYSPDGKSIMPIGFIRNGIAQSQTPGAAGNLTLNGSQVSAGVFTATHLGGWLISFFSAGNDSGRTLTITGINAVTGLADTEAVVGPNANIVVSTKYWSSVSQIAIDAAAAAALEVGFHFPLINVPATASGRLVNLINAISSVTNLTTKSLPVLAINIPAALLQQSRGFTFEWLSTFAVGAGGNKNPIIKLGTTTIKDFGAANLNVTNPLWCRGEVVKTAVNVQRVHLWYYLGGVIGLGVETAAAESETSGLTLNIYNLVLEDTAGVGQLEAFTLNMQNTP